MSAGSQQQRLQLILVDTFGSSFDLKDFIAQLTRGLVTADASPEATWNPSIGKKFERAVSDLRDLAVEVDEDIEELAVTHKVAEEHFQQELQQVKAAFDAYQAELRRVDSRLSRVATTAVQVGNQLATEEDLREAAQEALSLSRMFANLNEGIVPAALKKGSPIKERAHLLFRLRRLIQDHDVTPSSAAASHPPGTAAAVDGKAEAETDQPDGEAATDTPVASVARTLIKRCSDELEDELMDGFREAMVREKTDDMATFAASLVEWNGGEQCMAAYALHACKVRNPPIALNPSDPLEERLQDFFQRIHRTLDRQAVLLPRIFPDPDAAVRLMLRLVFEWIDQSEPSPLSIGEFLRQMNRASESQPLQQLALLSQAHSLTMELVAETDPSSMKPLARLLFAPYTAQYLPLELSCLNTQFQDILHGSSGLAGGSPSLVAVEVTKGLLAASSAATARATQLLTPKDQPGIVVSLFRCLVSFLSQHLVFSTLQNCLTTMRDKAYQRAKKRSSEDFPFPPLVCSVNLTVVELDKHYRSVVLPVLMESINERAACNTHKAKFLSETERLIHEGLTITLHSMHTAFADTVHSAQRRNDYRPSESSFREEPTQACVDSCKVIASCWTLLTSCLDGQNVTVFLSKLGLLCERALFEHLKKMSVTTGLGGIRLLQDLTHYRNTFGRFECAQVTCAFDRLCQLANIHFVEESGVQALVKDSLIAIVPVEDLKAYLSTHQHYRSTWLDELF